MMKAIHGDARSTATSAIRTPETSSLSAVVSRKLPSVDGLLPSAREAAVEEVGHRREREEHGGGGGRPRTPVRASTSAITTGVRAMRRYVRPPGRPRRARRRCSSRRPRHRTRLVRCRPARRRRGPAPPSRTRARVRRRASCASASRRRADGVLHRRDRGRGHRELAHAEPEQQRRRERIAGELAAHARPTVRRLGRRRVVAAIRRSTAGCSGSASAATCSLPRSAARVYCVRSFVPIEKKSASRARIDAVSAAGGHLDHDADLEGIVEPRRRPRASEPACAADSSSAVATIGNITLIRMVVPRPAGARGAARRATLAARARAGSRARRGTGSSRPAARAPGSGLSAPASRVRTSSGRSPSASAAARYAASCSSSSGMVSRSMKRNSVRNRPTPSAPPATAAATSSGSADVRGHLDRRAVARHRRLARRSRPPAAICAATRSRAASSRAIVSSSGSTWTSPAVAVERRGACPRSSVSADRTRRPRRRGCRARARARPRARSGRRGRSRRRGRIAGSSPAVSAGVEVGGDEDPRGIEPGRRDPDAQQPCEHLAAHAPQVGRPRAEVRVVERVPRGGDRLDRVAPGPAGAGSGVDRGPPPGRAARRRAGTADARRRSRPRPRRPARRRRRAASGSPRRSRRPPVEEAALGGGFVGGRVGHVDEGADGSAAPGRSRCPAMRRTPRGHPAAARRHRLRRGPPPPPAVTRRARRSGGRRAPPAPRSPRPPEGRAR